MVCQNHFNYFRRLYSAQTISPHFGFYEPFAWQWFSETISTIFWDFGASKLFELKSYFIPRRPLHLIFGFYGPLLMLSHDNGLPKLFVPTEYQQTICESLALLRTASDLWNLTPLYSLHLNACTRWWHIVLCTVRPFIVHTQCIVNEILAETKYISEITNAGTTHSRGLGGVKWA